MSIGWYLVVSARSIFSIGAGGVLTRRNPLVILLCLELMLNAANLALIAFARMWGNGDGQIFAIIVMVVAACEVCIGLGARGRHVPPPAADRRRRDAGAARLDADDRLAHPALPARRARSSSRWATARCPARVIGLVGTLAIAGAFVCRGRDLHLAAGPRRGRSARSSTSPGTTPTRSASTRKLSILVDPLSVFMALVVTGVSTLIHLYSVAYMTERPRLRALLRLPELLRLLDAAARAGGQLPAAHRRLGVRRRRLLPADLVLVPAHDGDGGGHQGVRHQRGRRRRPRAGHVLHLPPLAHAGLPGHLRPARRDFAGAQRGADRRAASCCSSARSRSPPRSRCTPGSRTRWRARRRSPR